MFIAGKKGLEIERKLELPKLSMTTFTYRSSSSLFYDGR
jgi:hypothetical protein